MAEDLDALGAAVVDALRRADGQAALDLVGKATTLARAHPFTLARFQAWTAQAHVLNGQWAEADRSIRQAIKTARDAGDVAGIEALRPLQARIRAALAPPTTGPLPDTPLGRACQALDAGDHVRGEALAREAREQARQAGNPRDEVLALLALARVPGHEERAIRAAARVADACGDPNLVTAVARSARALGIDLPPRVF